MKILIIQKKLMGDVLVSSIIAQAIKDKYPDAIVDFLIDAKYKAIIQNHQYINNVLHFGETWQTLKLVRKQKYDVIIDVYATFQSAIITFLSGAKKRISFFKKYTAFAYTHTIDRNRPLQIKELTTALEHRLLLLNPLQINLKAYKPKIYISEAESKQALDILKTINVQPQSFIILSTFGSIPEKTYPIKYMVRLIETIVNNTSCKILCNYLPHQKEGFLRLYQSLSEKSKNQVVKDFDTQNIRQYIAINQYAKALIGNEGGATNIAKALNIPTFSIYAPFIKGWEWFEDGKINVSIHADTYNVFDYEGFTPDLFKDKIIDFINYNIKK